MEVPAIHQAMLKVSRELIKLGIPKRHYNDEDGYNYRSIDDLLNTIAPVLVRARLTIRPRALERSECQKTGPDGELLTFVAVKIAFELSSTRDGSSVTIETFGEAADEYDKATAKALTAAYKTALIQTFCIPVRGLSDSERPSKATAPSSHEPEPLQGWEQWTADISELSRGCQSEDALRRLQHRYRALLRSLSRERPALYKDVGGVFAHRQLELQNSSDQLSDRKAAKADSLKSFEPAELERA